MSCELGHEWACVTGDWFECEICGVEGRVIELEDDVGMAVIEMACGRGCLSDGSKSHPICDRMGCHIPGKLDDAVNHPSHYTSHPSGVEAITITEHMTFCVGNAIKYLMRAGLKDCEDSNTKQIEDLRKAAWYATREADRLEKERSG